MKDPQRETVLLWTQAHSEPATWVFSHLMPCFRSLMGLTLSLNLTSQLLHPKLLDSFWSPVLIHTLSLTVSTFPSLSHIGQPWPLPSSSWHETSSLPFGMRALSGHLEVIKWGSRCDPGTQNPFQQKPRFRSRANTKFLGRDWSGRSGEGPDLPTVAVW